MPPYAAGVVEELSGFLSSHYEQLIKRICMVPV
jgi:hypothetical protein